MTFCPSEPLQMLCAAEERIRTNPACFQSKYGQKNMVGNILYRTHTVHHTLLLILEFTAALQKGNLKNK